jgi:hypothetical protein
MTKGGDLMRSRDSVWGPRLLRLLMEFFDWVLIGTGLVEIVLGCGAIQTGLSRMSAEPPGLLTLLFGAGFALAICGLLTCLRKRRELIERLLSALTAAAFALALVFLSREGGDQTADSMLTFAGISGACLLVTVLLSTRIESGHALIKS